jgi:predicted transcriptional regulator
MKLLELISEAKFSKQKQIGYHGTKPQYLRSIIKNGLIINFKEGGYGSGDEMGRFGVSLDPLESIYFTKTYRSAETISKSETFNSLVIAVSFQPKDTYMDEDDLWYNALDESDIKILYKKLRPHISYNMSDNQYAELTKIVDKMCKKYAVEKTNELISVNKLSNKIQNLLVNAIKNSVQEILLASISGESPNIREYQDKLTRYLKTIVGEKEHVRIPRNIGFSGSTKIVGLYYGNTNAHVTFYWSSIDLKPSFYGRNIQYKTPMELLSKVQDMENKND